MKKNTFVIGASAALVLGAFGALPAAAADGDELEYGDTICEAYTGGVRNLSVVRTGERVFEVTFVDLGIQGGVLDGNQPTSFLTMPESIRYGTNTVTVSEGITVSGISLSQSVVTSINPDADPDDPDVWYMSASPSAGHAHRLGDAQARIFRSADGAPWVAVTAEPLTAMPYALALSAGVLYAGMSDGSLRASSDAGGSWRVVPLAGDKLDRIRAMVVVEAGSATTGGRDAI